VPSIRTLGRLSGWLVLALALGFLGHSLWQGAPWRLAETRMSELAPAIGAGAAAYAFAGFLLAEAWRHLLGPGTAMAQPRHYHAIYGRTQIAKYLPGNCFHFLGRQLLGRRLGHAHGSLVLASLAESMLLLAVAGAIALPLIGPELARAWGPSPVWLALTMLAGVVVVVVIVCHSGSQCTRAMSSTVDAIRPLAPRVLRAGLLHLAFFAVGGLVLWAVAAAGGPPGERAIDLVTAVSVLAMAWWAGFVVPGAAAGIGVREAVLVLVLEPHLGAESALLVALTLRVITILGDLLFFALSFLTPVPATTAVHAIRLEC
jgi:glycosyltransferase 2 family protein